ncbi:hypothetical protein EDC04DRAFT_89588 [Pisolithus marmoratus]|nr:hypothetical protein EDC04DRAFT_89588 [Pisolithus marmoratus]
MSLACILFILIRYTSILVMVTSNYGFFATSFTEESCRRYYLVAPVFKDLQTTVSQAILGVRTFNIAGRNRHLGVFLLIYFCITVTLEWFFDLYRRTSQVVDGNCVSGMSDTHPTTWVFYLIAMTYDLVALVVSTVHLIRYKTYSGKFSFLIRVMIYDGLIFFVVLTAVNILNLILYQQPVLVAQSTGASLGYAVVWIMSQRILIHLRELAGDRSTSGVSPISNIVVHPGRSFGVGSQHGHQRTPPTPLRATHSSGISPPLDHKGAPLHDISNMDVDMDYSRPPPSPVHFQHHHPFSSSTEIVAPDDRHGRTADRDQSKSAGLDVQIRFEQSVTVDRHLSSNDGDTEDTDGTSEVKSHSLAIPRGGVTQMWA